MNKVTPSKRTLGISLFALGILLGSLLAGVLTWANLEATFYGFQYLPEDHFDGLSCPALMTPHETGIVQIRVSNLSNKTIEPFIRVDVSTRGAPDTQQLRLNIAPGETRQLEQPVTSENIDLGSFIFAKAYRYSAYPLSDADATCGIFILDVPFLSGVQIFSLWLTLSLALIPFGLWLWSGSIHPEGAGRLINAARVLAVTVLGGLFFSLQGVWGLGVFCLVFALLTSLAMLRFVAQK
jgi:hypothetical protein